MCFDVPVVVTNDSAAGVRVLRQSAVTPITTIDAAETDTLFLNQRHSPALRALRTERTEALVYAEHNVFGDFGDAQALYFGGDMNAAFALSGQVAGRIESILSVADIIENTITEFADAITRITSGVRPQK